MYSHYVSAYLYRELCTPSTIIGFILSPLVAVSPQCIAFRFILNHTGNNLANMWGLFGAWCLSNIHLLTPRP